MLNDKTWKVVATSESDMEILTALIVNQHICKLFVNERHISSDLKKYDETILQLLDQTTNTLQAAVIPTARVCQE